MLAHYKRRLEYQYFALLSTLAKRERIRREAALRDNRMRSTLFLKTLFARVRAPRTRPISERVWRAAVVARRPPRILDKLRLIAKSMLSPQLYLIVKRKEAQS